MGHPLTRYAPEQDYPRLLGTKARRTCPRVVEATVLGGLKPPTPILEKACASSERDRGSATYVGSAPSLD